MGGFVYVAGRITPVGLLERLRRSPSPTAGVGASGPIASPWADSGNLNALVWADILGTENRPVGRADAMMIPPVARGRHLIVGMIAKCPLVRYAGADLLEPAAWMQRTDAAVSPWHRMAWTVDDLIFSGWALWAVSRDADGHVLSADRVGRDRWSFDPSTNAIVVDYEPVPASDVVLIPGPHEGLLSFGSRFGIRHARSLYLAAETAAANPIPATELHQTDGDPMGPDAVDEMLAAWRNARLDASKAGIAYTNQSIEARFHGTVSPALLIDGRNAAALDIARFLGIPGSTIDATVDKASLNYETTAGRNAELIDVGLSMYMDAIAARLSMDDVLARGSRTAFDTAPIRTETPDPTGPVTED